MYKNIFLFSLLMLSCVLTSCDSPPQQSAVVKPQLSQQSTKPLLGEKTIIPIAEPVEEIVNTQLIPSAQTPAVNPPAPLAQLAINQKELSQEPVYAEDDLDEMKIRIGLDQVWVSEKPAHEFVGVAKCMLCHKSQSQGEQYRLWRETAHSRAYETLATQEAKELGAKLGIPDPQSSGKCLRCHSTAYYFGEQKVTEIISPEEGVSCESCHGPGKDYKGLKIMKDRKRAVEAGLVIPGEQTCLKCHNDSAPNVKEFFFESNWQKIKHPIPVK